MKQKQNTRRADNIDVQLAEKLGNLSGQIDLGFKGVNQRIDDLVLKVGAQNGRIGKLESTETYQEGIRKGISSFWKAVVVILTLGLGVLTYINLIKP